MRSERAVAPRGPAGARPANPPSLSEGASAPHRTRRRTDSLVRRRALGPSFARGHRSTRPTAAETPPRRPAHRAPVHDPPSARAQTPPLRPVPTPRRRGATRGDPRLLGDPSPPPTQNEQLAFAEPGLTRTPRSAPADVGR